MPAGSVILRDAASDVALNRITSEPKEGALPLPVDVVDETLEVAGGAVVVVGELVDDVVSAVVVVFTEVVATELVVVGILVTVLEVVRVVLVVVPEPGV